MFNSYALLFLFLAIEASLKQSESKMASAGSKALYPSFSDSYSTVSTTGVSYGDTSQQEGRKVWWGG